MTDLNDTCGVSATASQLRCGFAALVGRPNVGKSTLLNTLLGRKVTIVSRKPQTTRHRILGIHTLTGAQIVYVDTPGLHRQENTAMNRCLNRTATTVLAEADVAVFLVDALRWTQEDEFVLERLTPFANPVILALNKIDRLRAKQALLPLIDRLSGRRDFAAVVPVSASRGINLAALEAEIVQQLPNSVAYFPQEQITDRSERFMAAELIRERLLKTLGQELPYASTVAIEAFEQEGRLRRIAAVIWIERRGQKPIVIGHKGQRLKQIGRQAREEMEALFGAVVYLQLWVKVREGWSDDERALGLLGYAEP
ncbi:GTPase Era [Nitrococcus mobilis]|uniref:GTPase Era n=1 Tax=Nitrococcus mobilis Nb-231 TaxID=314278 RepID=A4BRZ5_9GAMM|nr:GTPase Era [Nitrococcus mobilis]EAR21474.1 GTP-binding protein Era [Nitrococcus mobilis Nb-231]